MNLTGSQIRKLEAMSDAELGQELRKHTHRNPVEEAYYRGVTGIALRRCLEKLNLLLERTEVHTAPSVLEVDAGKVSAEELRQKFNGVKVK